MLLRMLRNIAAGTSSSAAAPMQESPGEDDPGRPCVLNVGGSSKRIPIPPHYEGWRHLLLDIAPGDDVDLIQDARTLGESEAGRFDAVYCSHNLEHYFRHDGARVLAGFHHILKDDGFLELRVPDIPAAVAAMAAGSMDIDDVLYVSPAGPITVHDVLYGWGRQIEESGVDFFAHKQGFSPASLQAACTRAGFAEIWMPGAIARFEICALCFKGEPTARDRHLLRLDDADRRA